MIKQAEGLPTPTEAASTALKSDLWSQLGNIGVAGLGIGAGARGLIGLYNLMRRQSGSARQGLNPVPVDVPYPVAGQQKKQAFDLNDISKWWDGAYAEKMHQIPWAIPAATAVGLGSLAGGWGAVDSVLDKRRKGQLDEELQKTRQDFDAALLAQYDKPKTAAAELSIELDKLFDQATAAGEKQASLAGMSGTAAGVGMTVGGLGALATAMAVYNAVKKRNSESLLDSAQKRRLRRNYENNPTPLWARPVPVSAPPIPEMS